MQNHTLHIEKLDLINTIADEILNLEVNRGDLKLFAQQYARDVKSNHACISFFPMIDSEIRTNMEKKNFNITNAKDKIDKLSKLIPKLEYIKASVNSYSNLNDTELRKKSGLDNFKDRVENEIKIVSVSNLDGLYKKVADKYLELNQSGKSLSDLRSKYKSLDQMLAINAALIGYFPLVQKELFGFVQNMNYNESQVVDYLNSFAGLVQRLQAIRSNIVTYEGIKREDLRAVPLSYHDYFKTLANTVTYGQISGFLDTSNNNLKTITQRINSLATLRARHTTIKNKISSSKSNMYAPAYNTVVSDSQAIESSLFKNLDASFESSSSLLQKLENIVNSEIAIFSEKIKNSNQLISQLNNNKVAFWVEDHSTFADKIQQYRNTPSAASVTALEIELQNLLLVKKSRINQFENNNAFLLKASNKIHVLNTNYKSGFVSCADFELFAQSVEKNKRFKQILYHIKEFIMTLWLFLIRPKTIKTGAIIIGVLLAIAVVMSFWKPLLIGIIIIALVVAFFKFK